MDKLEKIYPAINNNRVRRIDLNVKKQLKYLYDNNQIGFLKALLNLGKFPINSPYIAFIKKNDDFIDLNPVIINKIISKLYEFSFEEIIFEIEAPIELNRQMGSKFKDYLYTINIPFINKKDFINKEKGVYFLNGSDNDLFNFSKKELNLKLSKRPDLIVKVNKQYIIGEAKFITDYGGHQSTQLNDALDILNINKENVYGIAILDGVIWINRNVKMHQEIKKQPQNKVLSILLLKKYLYSFLSDKTFSKKSENRNIQKKQRLTLF